MKLTLIILMNQGKHESGYSGGPNVDQSTEATSERGEWLLLVCAHNELFSIIY